MWKSRYKSIVIQSNTVNGCNISTEIQLLLILGIIRYCHILRLQKMNQQKD
jgi:hypothetical protein